MPQAAAKFAGADRADRELQLLRAASEGLNTDGVSQEWFVATASSLGISRPALYTYVSDRDDLLARCYEHSCEQLEWHLDRAVAGSSSVAEAIDLFLANAADPSGAEIAVLAEVSALVPDIASRVWARYEEVVSRLAQLLRDGIDEGRFRTLNAAIVARAIIGLVSWSPMQKRWRSDADPTLITAGARVLLFDGVGTDAGDLRACDIAIPRPTFDDSKLFDRDALDAARRERLLAAASRLFNRQGVGGTRVEDVADAVGISKRTVFHYFAGKAELLDASLERAFDIYRDIAAAALALPGPKAGALYNAHRTAVTLIADEVSPLLPSVGYGLLPAQRQAAFLRRGTELANQYRALLRDGQKDGSIRDVPIDALVVSMPGVFFWTAFGAAAVAELPVDDLASELATLVVLGINRRD